MMGLQFFIWGSWLPLIYSYLPSLKFTPAEQAWILNMFPLAAIVGMFFSNQDADRHFAAEKFLAFSHLAGGLAIFLLAFTQSFWLFLGLMLLHCLLYVPTLSIRGHVARFSVYAFFPTPAALVLALFFRPPENPEFQVHSSVVLKYEQK